MEKKYEWAAQQIPEVIEASTKLSLAIKSTMDKHHDVRDMVDLLPAIMVELSDLVGMTLAPVLAMSNNPKEGLDQLLRGFDGGVRTTVRDFFQFVEDSKAKKTTH